MFRQALERPLSRAAVAQVRSIPVPIKGWNTRDRYTDKTDSRYAPILTNWVVENGRIELRNGYATHATGLPSASVETLMAYSSSSSNKVFAAVGTEIYDVTAEDAVGSADVTSLTNARWSWTMFATTGGQYLVAVNGADGVRTYSGSAWASQTINNVTASTLVHVSVHKTRLWFIESGTTSLWYLATLAIAGDATELNLGSLLRYGGELIATGSWTFDGGSGPDDYFVIITDKGEVVVYAGTDPSSASTWSLVGIYKIDQPLGRNCMIKYGGDLAILTESGVVQMSEVLRSIAGENSFSEEIRDQYVAAAGTAARDVYGWQVFIYPLRGWLMVNVPTNVTNTFFQFAYSTVNRAWFKFAAIPAICWLALDDDIFFGGADGGVYRFDTGTSDNGAAIVGDYQPMWSRFGTSRKKRFTQIRPNFFTDGSPSPKVSMRVDFDESAPTSTPTVSTAAAGSDWDAEDWDDAIWGGGLEPWARWITVSGAGIVGAPRITISTTSARLSIVSIDVAFEVGGII